MRALLVTAVALLATSSAQGATYYVALTGSDTVGDGSQASPWRTLDHALNTGISAAGGDTVMVEDGLYSGTTTLSRTFASPVQVRAEHPYHVTLTNVAGGQEALRVWVNGSVNITFEGFYFTNHVDNYTCPNGRETYYLVHLQDASDVTLRDNIFYGNNAPGTCNEVLKINRSATDVYPRGIHVIGNVFYDPANAAGADLIDSVRPGEIEITDNIFFSDPTQVGSQSFITLKRQAPDIATTQRPRFRVARNIFYNWGGRTDQAFLQFGEDTDAEYMITDALVENNLFVGNSGAHLSGAMQFKGVRRITVRANTVVGDLPSSAYALRLGTEGSNPEAGDVDLRNNVFDDPTGTMGTQLITTYGLVDLSTILLAHNLYWNAGQPLPTSGSITPAMDTTRLVADPLLPASPPLVLARWDPQALRFLSGNGTIREEFLRLVSTYGATAAGSPAAGAADPANMPADDIRGLPRDSAPDLGAFELGAEDAGTPSDGGTPADAGSPPDAGAASAGNPTGRCGCTTAGAPPLLVLGALALLAARGARRRNRC